MVSSTDRAPLLVLVVLVLGVAVLLQGCGGGDGGKSTTTSTTTTSTHKRSAPLSAARAAEYLNGLYLGFNETDDSSPLGVTISMAAQVDTFYGNIFCSSFANPHNATGCYEGQAECRMSASLYSHAWDIDKTTHKTLLGLGRAVGYVFNQTMVETTWGKCSFIWDGASGNRYNRGCGDGAPGTKCDNVTKASAFYNICPSTNKTCTASDDEVKRALCSQYGGVHPIPPTHGGHAQCVFPGPALNYHQQDEYKPGENKLRDMAKARIKYNSGSDKEGPNIEKWNEIVLDEYLLLPDIWYDPARAIPAFVYTKSQLPISKRNAEAMRDEFCTVNGVEKIPVVEIDDTVYRPEGPFQPPEEEKETAAGLLI